MRLLPILVLCLPLLTGGCFVGDGVAHVVKLAQKSGKSDSPGQTSAAERAPAAQRPAPAAAPIDRDPAPMPATAPAVGIQSEELAPPR